MLLRQLQRLLISLLLIGFVTVIGAIFFGIFYLTTKGNLIPLGLVFILALFVFKD